MKISTPTNLKFVPFAEINLWDVKRYSTKSNLQFENVVTLRDILIPHKNPVTRDEIILNKWQIISKINFGGELFLRNFEEIKTYKGNLNLVPDNTIIYSKINVRHGCIYFHDKGKQPFAVSSEYPTFSFDETKISGKFLHRVLRSNAFKALLGSKTSGISKARVKQDEFLDIQIPLPSLEDQERIVNRYILNYVEAENFIEQAKEIETEVGEFLYGSLGFLLKQEKRQKNISLQFTNFESIVEWGLDKILSSSNMTSSKYPLTSINEHPSLMVNLCRGKSPKYKNGTTSFILNQKCNRWNEIDLTFAKSVDEEWLKSMSQIILTKEGDILINSTGEGTIGRASFVSKKFEGLLYDSHLLLLRLDSTKMNPELFVEIFNSKFGQNQVNEKKSAQATNQTELGTSNLAIIKFPLVENMVEQNRIVSRIKDLRTVKANCLKESILLREKAEQEFEKAIFNI
jgi:restriction endonuclease S subunit